MYKVKHVLITKHYICCITA